MTQARKNQISISDTAYYHCLGRCVRRAFLCGEDSLTGKDYSHRKQWIVDKLKELADIFAIDVCAYAVMSNHYHLVLKIDNEQSELFSDEEVIERWIRLFNGNVLIQRFLKGDCKTQGELDKVQETIALWRERLSDISWFMRCLNETIARQANAEDQCTGRFWEGRFKSQALLNQQAVLSCMVYVDLNPIRAGLADSLDDSNFTSIGQRLKQFAVSRIQSQAQEKPVKKKVTTEINLAKFVGSNKVEGIPYLFMDYLELADWTGRAVREDKTGTISDHKPKILSKLGIDPKLWFKTVNQYAEHSYSHLGTEQQIKDVCIAAGKSWIAGIRNCRQLFV